MLINQAKYFYQFAPDLRFTDNINDRCIWVRSITAQALSLNTDLLIMDDTLCRAGPCTDILLYQVAAASVTDSSSGFSGISGIGSTGNLLVDHFSGLEARFMCEVGHAATGLKRSDANTLVKEIYKKYESTLKAPLGEKNFKIVMI